MNHTDPAIQFLLLSCDPSVRYFTLTDLLDAAPDAHEVVAARKEIPNGARVRALLAGQSASKRKSGNSFAAHPGGFGVHPYKKWDGAHWRLVSLAELGNPADDPRAQEALDIIEQKRQPDGTWHAEASYWKPKEPCEGSQNLRKVPTSNTEVVDLGHRGSNEMITLNALRVLKTGGRAN